MKIWIEAYSLLVHSVGNFLFSWLHIKWINISQSEHHVIAISSLLGVSAYRATIKIHREWGYDFSLANDYALPLLVRYFLLAFVPCLLLPDYWGTAVAAICVVGNSVLVVRHKHSPWGPISSQAPGKAVLVELAGILALLVIVLVLNYAIVRPNEV